MIDAAKRAVNFLRDPEVFRFRQALGLHSFAPFPRSLYRDLLIELKEKQVAFQPISSPEMAYGTTCYIRHDIDTLGCVENALALAHINVDLNLPAAAYFRVDAEEYQLADQAVVVHQIAELGVEVGLHTSCYIDDDPFSKLRADRSAFVSATGIEPTSFTLHGFGHRKLINRFLFRHGIAKRLDEFGFQFTDCWPRLRRYRHVVEDCHVDPKTGSRHLLKDVERTDELAGIAGSILVLTHPCYWTI